MQQDSTWHHFHEESIAVLTDLMQEVPAWNPIGDYHTRTRPIFHHHFSCNHCPPQDDPFQRKRTLKQIAVAQTADPPGVFMAWKFWAKFVMERKAQGRRADELVPREMEADQLIADAQHAADTHNQFHLYGVINKYSPKQPRQQLALKNNGHLLTSIEAHTHLTDFVRSAHRKQAPVSLSAWMSWRRPSRRRPCAKQWHQEQLQVLSFVTTHINLHNGCIPN